MRGVMTLAAYRSYYIPAAALQWTTYLLWLQGRAEGLGTSALRELDVRARTHLARYRAEFHDAASLADSVGLAGPLVAAPAPQPATGTSRPAQRHPNEQCLRYNFSSCMSGGTCWRLHTCTHCRGPHPARQCLLAAPGPSRPAPARLPPAAPRTGLQRPRWQ